MRLCVYSTVNGPEEIFEICCISNGIKIHLQDSEQVEEEANVEDCILLMDVSL